MLSSTLHGFPRTEIDILVAVVFVAVGQAAVEHGLAGGHQLDDARHVLGDMALHSREQAWQFHRHQQLLEEALLDAFKPRPRRAFRPRIERIPRDRIDDIGRFESGFHILVNDALSRGSDNAQERGIVAEFLHCRAILLHIILIANLGGLWTS